MSANKLLAIRPLHYVFKMSDRKAAITFYRNVLGMKVLRHEEFTEGCEATCNGPYQNRWSKTMVGYGPESTHFVIELVYNYGKGSYSQGNDFCSLTIQQAEIRNRAKTCGYPMEDSAEEGHLQLISPDGTRVLVREEPTEAGEDPVKRVVLRVSNLERSRQFWEEQLMMIPVPGPIESGVLRLKYPISSFVLELRANDDIPVSRAETSGRIAFAIPFAEQESIDERIRRVNGTILTPLTSLDTPGKATVRVIILADPDGHEICFVDEEGFQALSVVDPESDAQLMKYIAKDPYQSDDTSPRT